MEASLDILKRIVLPIIHHFGYDLTNFRSDTPHLYKRVTIEPSGPPKGRVLLSYVIESFLTQKPDCLNAHTHYWESYQIAQTFLNLGYRVDVIDYRNSRFVPKKKYAFFVGARTEFQRISSLINADCIKIAHLDMAHWLFNNLAAYKRLSDFQKKTGVTASNVKFQEINWAIEHADYVTILGNDFTIDTYRYAKKPIFRIPISTCSTFPTPVRKDFNACRSNFLWMGSHGLVHKGLDLVLDAFVEMPEHHLYVLGPLDKEVDFVNAYHDALYNQPNIHTIGWVDVSGADFAAIVNKCVAMVYPSCAEGGGGSVVNCMHAGLIPIVSYESSVDTEDFGVVLTELSVEEIKRSVKLISQMPEVQLKKMGVNAWNFARKNHTRDQFARVYQQVVENIENETCRE